MQKPGSSKRDRQVHPLLIHVNECKSYTPGELNTVSVKVEERETISIDGVPLVSANENDKGRKNSNWQEFVNETTFHGIKYVFIPERQRVRRLMWLALVLTAVGLFTYQVVDRTRDFLDYQSTVNIKLVHNKSVDFPAVTICNLNSFRLTETAKRGLYYYIDDIYSNLSFNVNPPEKVKKFEPEKILQTTAHQAEDLFVRCRWKGKPCNISEAFKPRFTRLGLCYTFNMDNDSAQVTQSGAGFGLDLIMNIESYEYMKGPEDQVGVKVLLHSPTEVPLVKDLGFAVAPGTHTLIGIKQTRVSHLPKPYGECRPDVIQTSNCMFESRAQNIASECHCREPFMKSVTDDMTPCNMTKTFTCVLREWFFMNQDDVRNTCPVPCNRITYEPVLSYAHLSKIRINRIYKEKISSARDPYIHAKEVARRLDPAIAGDDRTILTEMINEAVSYQKSVSLFSVYMEKKPNFSETLMFRRVKRSKERLWHEVENRLGAHRSIVQTGKHISSMLATLNHILPTFGKMGRLFKTVCRKTDVNQNVTNSSLSKQKNTDCYALSETDTGKIQSLKQKLQDIKTSILKNMSQYIDAQGRLFDRTGGWDDDNAHVTCLGKRLDLHGSWEANLMSAVNACTMLLRSWPFNHTSLTKAISDLRAYKEWITSDITAATDSVPFGYETCKESKSRRTYYMLRDTYDKFDKPFQAVAELPRKINDSYDTLHRCLMGCNQTVSYGIKLFPRLLESYQEGNEVNTKENGTFYSTLLEEVVRSISQSHENCITLALEYTKKLQYLENNMSIITDVYREFDQFKPMRKRLSTIFHFRSNSKTGFMAGQRINYYKERWIARWFDPMVKESKKIMSKYAKLKNIMDKMRTKLEVLTHANVIDDGNFFMDNYIKMDIFYRSLSYEEISQQRAFEFLSLLSEIGGFLGLLLGASVLTVFELLDYLAGLALNKWKATCGCNSLGN